MFDEVWGYSEEFDIITAILLVSNFKENAFVHRPNDGSQSVVFRREALDVNSLVKIQAFLDEVAVRHTSQHPFLNIMLMDGFRICDAPS